MGRRLRRDIEVIRLLTLGLIALAVSATAAPKRIASLNLCADQLLLELVEPSRIASVTWLALDPTLSPYSEVARGLPVNFGRAEEILPQQPDLVLVGQFTAPAATMMLRRFGFRVETVVQPRDLDGIKAEIRRFGVSVGSGEKAETIVAAMERRLAALPPAPDPRPVAAVLRPGAVTFGPESMVNALLAAAGYENFAARLDLGRVDRMPLEALLLGRPDILIISHRDLATPSLAQSAQAHRALDQIAMRRVVVPSWTWTCAGPSVVEAIERLVAART